MADHIDLTLNACRDALALTRCYLHDNNGTADAVISSMTADEIELALVSAASMYAIAIQLLAGHLGQPAEQLAAGVARAITKAEADLRSGRGI